MGIRTYVTKVLHIVIIDRLLYCQVVYMASSKLCSSYTVLVGFPLHNKTLPSTALRNRAILMLETTSSVTSFACNDISDVKTTAPCRQLCPNSGCPRYDRISVAGIAKLQRLIVGEEP